MTNAELDRLDALVIAPVAVMVTPKPPQAKHAVLIREDGSFLMPDGSECESLYKHSDCKAVADAKAALVAEVRRLRGLVEAAFDQGHLAGHNGEPYDEAWSISDARKALDP